MHWENTHQCERNGCHDGQLHHKRAEPSNRQNIDEDEDRSERQAQVAENFDGDVLLAISPMDGKLLHLIGWS